MLAEGTGVDRDGFSLPVSSRAGGRRVAVVHHDPIGLSFRRRAAVIPDGNLVGRGLSLVRDGEGLYPRRAGVKPVDHIRVHRDRLRVSVGKRRLDGEARHVQRLPQGVDRFVRRGRNRNRGYRRVCRVRRHAVFGGGQCEGVLQGRSGGGVFGGDHYSNRESTRLPGRDIERVCADFHFH